MARRRKIDFRQMREVTAQLRAMPKHLREEMYQVLEEVGISIKAKMKAKAPVKTGALKEGIDHRASRKTLTLRVGLLNTKRGRANLFYGRIQDLGRREQVVIVRKLKVSARAKWVDRIAKGQASSLRKPDDLVKNPYPMRVKASPGKHFITGRFTDLRNEARTEIHGIYARATAAASGSAAG